jgi:hypothetical protein
MARLSPAQKMKRLRKALTAWERLRPNRAYSGITLAEFKQVVQACLDARAEIDEFRARLRHALTKRDHSDFRAIRLHERLGYAIQGDPDEPLPSDFHIAIGYVPRELRRRPRRRKRKATT